MNQPESQPAAGTFGRDRLVRGGAVVAVGTVIQKVVSFGYVALLARWLSVDVLGVYSFALAFGTIASVAGDLGVDQVAIREVSARSDKERGAVIGTAMVGKAIAATVTFLLAVGASMFFDDRSRVPALLAASVIFTTVPATTGIALVGRMQPLWPVVLKTLSQIAIAGAVLGAARAGMSVTTIIVIQVAANVATTGVSAYVTWRLNPYRLEFDPRLLRLFARSGGLLAVSTLFVVVYGRIDQILLGMLADYAEVGRYAVAVRLVDGINWLPVAAASVALPTLSHLAGTMGSSSASERAARARRLTRKGYRYLAVGILPLTALAAVIGGPIMAAVFGSQFGGSGQVLALLLVAQFFGGAWVVARQVLIANDALVYLVVLAAAAAVVNVALNLLLIPTYGATGSAWATLASYAAPFAVALAFGRIRWAFASAMTATVRPVVASMLILGALLLAAPAGAGVVLAAFVLAGPSAVLLTRALTVSELREMALSFRRKRAPTPQPS